MTSQYVIETSAKRKAMLMLLDLTKHFLSIRQVFRLKNVATLAVNNVGSSAHF